MGKQTYGSGSGSSDMYVVEARSTVLPVRRISGMELTKEWQQVHFADGPVGVYSFPLHPLRNDYLGLFTYEAAIALAHWFMTCPDTGAQFPYHATGIEARLVRIKLTYSYATEEIGIGEAFNHGDMHKAAKWVKRDDADTEAEHTLVVKEIRTEVVT